MLAIKIIFKTAYQLLSKAEGRTFLWLCFWYWNVKKQKNKTIKFKNIRWNVVDCLSFLWQFEEIFVQHSYQFVTTNTKPIIVDCGANVGLSILYFKQLYPDAKVIAFEADEQIAQVCKQNLVANQINDVELISKAVWVDDKGIEIALTGADSASIYGEGNKITVSSIRLRDFLISFTVIDMLKIDIEGAEALVISDCADVLDRVNHLFIEYHDFSAGEQYLDVILQILTRNKFRYFIHNAVARKSPLVNYPSKYTSNTMDLQINIFAYKVSI